MMAFLDPNLRMIDRRRIGWPEQNLDSFRDRIRSLLELDAEFSFVIARVHRAEGRLSLVEEVTTVTSPNGAVQVDRNLLLAEVSASSGLTLRMEQFAGDDLDTALACYDEWARELAATGELGNAAVWLCNRTHSWARSGSWERTASMFADNLVIDDEQGATLVAGRDGLADLATASRVGFGAADRQVLAVRGERLALMEWRDDDLDGEPFHRFALIELNSRAEFEHITLFDWNADSLIAAADLLNERWDVVEELSDLDRLGLEFIHAFRHRDAERLSAVTHDDFRAVDTGRSLGWGQLDKSTWLELFDDAEQTRVVTIVGRQLESSEIGFAVRMSQWGLIEGHLVEALPGCFAVVAQDGRIVRVEASPPDEPDAAVARLAELTAEMTRPDRHEPWNAADERTRGFMNRLVSRDVEGYSRDVAEDVVLDDRRPLIHAVYRGRDEVVAVSAPGIYPPDSNLVAEVEAIASRGDNLVLHHSVIREFAADGGPTMEWLGVTQWDGDRLIHAVLFDPDDLASAITELDRLYLATNPGALAHAILRGAEEGFDAHRGGSAEDHHSRLDDHFESIDHRQIGWPTLDRSTVLDRPRSMADLGEVIMFVKRIHRLAPVHVLEIEARVSRTNQSQGIVGGIIVGCPSPESGLALRSDIFPVEDLSSALARFAELEDEQATRGQLGNLATSSAKRAHTLMRRNRWDLALPAFADDLVISGRDDSVLVSGREAITDPVTARVVGFGVEHRRALAVRGDRLALMEWRDDDLDGTPFHRFAVVELNEQAEFERIALFDWNEESLIAAADLLEGRWVEIDNAVATSPVFEFLRAFGRRDGRRLFELTSDDVVLWDRRPLGCAILAASTWSADSCRSANRAAPIRTQFGRLAMQAILSRAWSASTSQLAETG
jgi:hypothetical protein